MKKTKICSKCKIRKKLSEFYKDKNSTDGRRSSCKKCYIIGTKKYNQIHKTKIRKQRKKWYENNKKIQNKRTQTYYKKNKKKFSIWSKKWREENKKQADKTAKKWLKKNMEKMRNWKKKYNKEQRKNNINFKLLWNLRSRVANALKKNLKSVATKKLLGCSVEFLKQHLENQFKKGMTWKNYGQWHIDHIIPCYKFDLSKTKEQRKCFNYINLRPLWAMDNLRRSKK